MKPFSARHNLLPKTSAMPWRALWRPMLCALFLLWIARVPAQDYLGAAAVLQQAHLGGTPAAKKQNPMELVRHEVETFGRTSASLPPAEAARRWLELVDRTVLAQRAMTQNTDFSVLPIGANDLLAVLPPPAAWPELAKAIAARPPAKSDTQIRESGLRLLAAALTGDSAARSTEITNLQVRARTAGGMMAYQYNNALTELSQAIQSASDDPAAILKSLGYQMGYGQSGVHQLEVPNLVSLIGPEKAETFLRQALVTPNLTLEFSSANETSRLAQKLALELMDQLKSPPWGLVNSLDAVPLYEALNKHFAGPTNNLAALMGLKDDISDVTPPDGMGDDQKQQAQVYYMLGLISQNRTAEAVAIAKQLKGQRASYLFEEAFKAMDHAGYTDVLDDFLHDLLAQDPTLPFWDQYVGVSASAGQTGRMLALMRGAVTNADLTDSNKREFHRILFKALLAADDVAGGMQEARQLMTNQEDAAENNGYTAGRLSVIMARIGILVQQPALTEEGITTAKKWLATPAGQNLNNGETADIIESLTQILFELKRGPEAETILTSALANAVRPANAPPEEDLNQDGSRRILTALAMLYYQAGRYPDVLVLLQESPDWGVKDLSELFDSSAWDSPVSLMFLHTGTSPMPVPSLAANSLAASGQKDVAQKINDALLDRFPGLDRGYELMLALEGTNALPRLDELFSRDQFEERPLIWKAHLLRQQNQLDAAEKLIRQAIAIDPSDGEEGRGDRMRAYTELADLLDARGDTNAVFYREIVKSIRMSETADQYYQAGLLSRAVPMYEQALTHFSDAYCIQSRLAIQLADLGKNAEAEEHYRRAYELMPDSFGRVESHCFGCERAFDGQRAQSIAEKVFTQLAITRPDKPQVHYLLGYLRAEEERYHEAVTNYLTAVRLDPDYLNAWVKAQDASEQILMPAQQRDEIAFNILRLDPLHRHATPSFARISDLNRLWAAVATAASHQPVLATNLYPLTASQIALEKKAASSATSRQTMQMGMIEQMRTGDQTLTPAGAIAQTAFVRLAGEMILNGNSDFGDN